MGEYWQTFGHIKLSYYAARKLAAVASLARRLEPVSDIAENEDIDFHNNSKEFTAARIHFCPMVSHREGKLAR